MLGSTSRAGQFMANEACARINIAENVVLHKVDRVDASIKSIVHKVIEARVLATSTALGAVLGEVGAFDVEVGH